MQSGDRSAIQDLVSNRNGNRFTCPFRLHYIKSNEMANDDQFWWDLSRHESRHMHPLNLY